MGLPDFLRSLRGRDRNAVEFDRLMREHIPAFYRSAYRWTGSVEQAEDLVQDLLARLYPRLEELRRLDQVKPWAMRVMYRIFIDQLRRERSSPVQFGLESPADEDADTPEASESDELGPDVLVERHLTQERIVAAWQELNEDQRVVLSMHDIEEYSLVEIAAMTDTPVGTLKSRVHRARARLKEILGRERSDNGLRVSSREPSGES